MATRTLQQQIDEILSKPLTLGSERKVQLLIRKRDEEQSRRQNQ